MDNLDLDVFEEFNSSQDSNSSFSSQETVPCAYFDNSISFCDQSQFVPNYNPNLATVEMPSYQNQNFGVMPVNSSSSNLTPNLYYNNNNNMNFNGFNNPGYFVCQGGPPTWQPSPQIQGDFSQVNSSILDFQNTPGEFSNVITGYGNIAPGASIQFQNQVNLPPVHFTHAAPSSEQTATSTGNFVEENVTHAEAPPPSVPVASSDELDKKLAQKRERNRIAARKCRDKKFSRIKLLQSKIEELDEKNHCIGEDINMLRERKNQLQMMLANVAFSQLNTDPDTLTQS